MKAARKEELSPRLTPQGQSLLQASRAAVRAIQPTAASMREAYLHSLSLKCAPQQRSSSNTHTTATQMSIWLICNLHLPACGMALSLPQYCPPTLSLPVIKTTLQFVASSRHKCEAPYYGTASEGIA